MIGKTISHYRILEKLGEGGMGVVYKAEDTKLKREVALKFLPTNALQGQEEKDRFTREAQAAAALNHPNIAHIYAIDEADGQMFLAMEFIEGQSLDEMITPLNTGGSRPLPIDRAIDYATQIAAGLQAAHEKGITHRDIKSANIMVTDQGIVKIMDFGLAKLANRSKMTQLGTTLGTAAYMSPEQARGDEADNRSDIWSLGVVLYEMISGQLPFKGDYEQAVIYAILNEEPEPLTALRSGLPIALDGIIAKALAKDPKIRYQHVDELPADLSAIEVSRVGTSPRQPKAALASGFSNAGRDSYKDVFRRWAIPLGFAAIVGLAIAGWMNRTDRPPIKEARFLVPLTKGYASGLGQPNLALSPDGQILIYASEGQLYIKPGDTFEGRPLPGTEGAGRPFFSPDGRWLGFNQGGALKKLAIDGGQVLDIVSDVGVAFGASWSEDDDIVYAAALGGSGLWRVPAAGGVPEQITTVRDSLLETGHIWPQVLPGGDLVMFTVIGPSGGWDDARLIIKNLNTGHRITVLERATYGRYLNTGHLIYAQDTGALVAVPFGLEQLQVTGSPVPVQSDVRVAAYGGAASYAVSDNGTLAFVRGSAWEDHFLRWVDRDGNSSAQLGTEMNGGFVKLSPDAEQIAMTIRGPNNDDIFLIEAATGERERFSFAASEDESPIWSPDGAMIAYSAAFTGQARQIFLKRVDGTSKPKLLYTGKNHLHLSSWSPAGRWLAMYEYHPLNQSDIWAVSIDEPDRLLPIATTEAAELDAQFAPNGRWLSYTSDESGRNEIYVLSFPKTETKHQVSDGGMGSRWAMKTKELFFWSNQSLMAATVSTGGRFRRQTPKPLFTTADILALDQLSPEYDVTPDATRFLLLANAPSAAPKQIHVVLNWFEELKRKVPIEK